MRKDIGKKVLNGLKNSWKLIPWVGLGNYFTTCEKDKEKKEYVIGGKALMHFVWAMGATIYLVGGVSLGNWTPNQYKEFNQKQEKEYRKEVNQNYNQIINDCQAK